MNDTLNYNFKSVCVKEKMHLKREKNNNIYKLIINNSFDDTAINLLYSNIYNK